MTKNKTVYNERISLQQTPSKNLWTVLQWHYK